MHRGVPFLWHLTLQRCPRPFFNLICNSDVQSLLLLTIRVSWSWIYFWHIKKPVPSAQLWSGLCLSFFPTYFPPPDTFKILFGMVLSFGFVWFFFQLSSHNYVLARMFSLSLFNRTTFACSWYCMSCFSAAVTNALKAACGRVDFGLQLQRHSIMAGKVCPQREEAGWSFFNHTQEGENRKWSHLKALKAPLQWHAFSIKAGTPKEFINSPKLHHEPGTKCSKSWASK